MALDRRRARSFPSCCFFFFFNDPATPEIYPLPLHAALPISYMSPDELRAWIEDVERLPRRHVRRSAPTADAAPAEARYPRSEEHTSELQSPCNLVCRLLLEKKKE